MTQTQFCINFVLAVFATWRVTHLLANEDGPADLIVKLRVALGDSLAGKLMDCFNCLSLWIAAPAALFVARAPLAWLFVWLGLSGAACLLQRVAPEPAVVLPFSQPSEGEVSHVLWSETSSSAERPADGEIPHSSQAADQWDQSHAGKPAPNGAYRE
jgi:hypothetical protein